MIKFGLGAVILCGKCKSNNVIEHRVIGDGFQQALVEIKCCECGAIGEAIPNGNEWKWRNTHET